MVFRSTPFHGKLARTEVGGTATDYTTGWSITMNQAMADASRQGKNWTEALPGQASWNGDVSMEFVPGNTQQKALLDNLLAGTGVLLTTVKFLLEDGTHAFIGDIFLIGFSVNPGLDGTVMWTITWQGNEEVAITDAA